MLVGVVALLIGQQQGFRLVGSGDLLQQLQVGVLRSLARLVGVIAPEPFQLGQALGSGMAVANAIGNPGAGRGADQAGQQAEGKTGGQGAAQALKHGEPSADEACGPGA
ncbi:hypothetical protein D9M71_787090 [compost metagenome]